jgi:hypothetical protein
VPGMAMMAVTLWGEWRMSAPSTTATSGPLGGIP